MMCSFPNMLFEFVVYQVNPFSCLLCSKHEKLALPDLFWEFYVCIFSQ